MPVYVDGVFDLFHAGHVNFLRAAKELAAARGTTLTVGVVGDAAAASYKRTPVLTLAERWTVVAACRYADKVVPDPPLVLTESFLDAEGIELVLHGDDSEQSEFFAAALRRGVMHYIPYTEGISTSAILARTQLRAAALPGSPGSHVAD